MHAPGSRHGTGRFDFMFIVAHRHELPIQERKRGAAEAAQIPNPVDVREYPIQLPVDPITRVSFLCRTVDGTGQGGEANARL